MPTRFAAPHKGTRWRPTPVFHSESGLVCRPTDVLAKFASCRHQRPTAGLSVRSLAVQRSLSRNEPSESRTRIRHRRVSNPRAAEWTPVRGRRISLNPTACEDLDGRPIRHKRAVRASLKHTCEFGPVKATRFTFKSGFSGRPYLPGNVGDMIFEGTAVALSRITPVVFGNELFHAPLLRMRWKTESLSREAAPMIANPPAIFSGLVQPFRLNVVVHWTISVVLAI
jgi:hypothetical protein